LIVADPESAPSVGSLDPTADRSGPPGLDNPKRVLDTRRFSLRHVLCHTGFALADELADGV
jgi:hypothetical protein